VCNVGIFGGHVLCKKHGKLSLWPFTNVELPQAILGEEVVPFVYNIRKESIPPKEAQRVSIFFMAFEKSRIRPSRKLGGGCGRFIVLRQKMELMRLIN
jgi:hypothetical protein